MTYDGIQTAIVAQAAVQIEGGKIYHLISRMPSGSRWKLSSSQFAAKATSIAATIGM
jgi:hypothetical protein